MHFMACMYKKEANQVESDFCFYLVDLKGQRQVVRPGTKHLRPLNCLIVCLFDFEPVFYVHQASLEPTV